jgi:hypothetical protein
MNNFVLLDCRYGYETRFEASRTMQVLAGFDSIDTRPHNDISFVQRSCHVYALKAKKRCRFLSTSFAIITKKPAQAPVPKFIS